MDLNLLNAELYFQNVLVVLKHGTQSCTCYGKSRFGKLTGRIMGAGKQPSIVAITLRTDDGEIHIPCADISMVIRENTPL